MRNVLLAFTLIATCTILVACGDSGSTTSSTKTATVPDGKLGNQPSLASCTPPKIAGFTISSLTAAKVDCFHAIGPAVNVIRTGKTTGWNCVSQSSASDGTRVICTGADDTAKQITFIYKPS